MGMVWGWGPGTEYFAGYITEKSLSVDNLFVFLIIMTKFAVPREYQQKVLLVGVVIALILRTVFILAGAAAIEQFSWVFYIFGAFLVYTGVKLAREHHDAEHPDPREERDGIAVRLLKRLVPTDGGVPRRPPHGADRRQAVLHADARRHGRDRVDRPAVRARLDPRDLRPDRGAVHRLHGQRVRAAGPASAVLPHRRSARAAHLPVAGPRRHPRRSSASSWCCTPCTSTSCPSSTTASPSSGRPRSPSGCRSPSSSAPSSWRPWPSLLKTRNDERIASSTEN